MFSNTFISQDLTVYWAVKLHYEYRKNFGAELAKEENIEADLVVPVPDSGNAAALGYSQQKKMSFDLGLIEIIMLEELLLNHLKK